MDRATLIGMPKPVDADPGRRAPCRAKQSFAQNMTSEGDMCTHMCWGHCSRHMGVPSEVGLAVAELLSAQAYTRAQARIWRTASPTACRSTICLSMQLYHLLEYAALPSA